MRYLSTSTDIVNETRLTLVPAGVNYSRFNILYPRMTHQALPVMTSSSDPLWRDVTIINELGLHARAAAKVAKAAQEATGPVWLSADADDEPVDATQVIDILTLGVGIGTQLRVSVENENDADVLNQIAALFADGFGE